MTFTIVSTFWQWVFVLTNQRLPCTAEVFGSFLLGCGQISQVWSTEQLSSRPLIDPPLTLFAFHWQTERWIPPHRLSTLYPNISKPALFFPPGNVIVCYPSQKLWSHSHAQMGFQAFCTARANAMRCLPGFPIRISLIIMFEFTQRSGNYSTEAHCVCINSIRNEFMCDKTKRSAIPIGLVTQWLMLWSQSNLRSEKKSKGS